MTDEQEPKVGQEVRISPSVKETREEVWDYLGERGVIVYVMNDITLVEITEEGENEGKSVALNPGEFSLIEPPSFREIGERVTFMHEDEDKNGTIVTIPLHINEVLHYGIQDDADGHRIIRAADIRA